jgi:hypothetical protein
MPDINVFYFSFKFFAMQNATEAVLPEKRASKYRNKAIDVHSMSYKKCFKTLLSASIDCL